MSIKVEKPPHNMKLAELEHCCIGEMGKYRRNEPYNDQYCLEIFRRAMLLRDAQAWSVLEKLFHTIVRGWIRCHPKKDIAYRYDSEDGYVAQVFERLWHSSKRNETLEFSTLAAALGFLRRIVNSAIIDTLRFHWRSRETPLPEPGFAEEPVAHVSDDGKEMWEAIESLLPNARERRLAYLLYHCGLKPREVVRFCPGEFDNVQEIFRIKRNIVERLVRNKERLRWLLGDDI